MNTTSRTTLRLAAILFVLSVWLAVSSAAHGAGAEPNRLVTLRPVAITLESRGTGQAPPSCPATLIDRTGAGKRWMVEVVTPSGSLRGLADPSAFLVLDDPAETVDGLVGKAQLVLGQDSKPVLAAALLGEAVRRDPARVEAWRLLGSAGEQLASTYRPGEGGRPPLAVTLGALWGVKVQPTPDGRSFRYDGDAYRRLIALAPSPEVGEEARVRLLTKCGPVVDVKASAPDLAALRTRERDLAEFVGSYPQSKRRVALLLERAQILSLLAETAAVSGRSETASADREAAIEAASEVSSTAADGETARRRAADRLIARLTRSFPRTVSGARAVVAASGARAWFAGIGRQTFLHVTAADGHDVVQPFEVPGGDPATLTFDPSGARLVWDESPAPGRRRTRLLDLGRARVLEPAALAEPELLTLNQPNAPVSPVAAPAADRYTTFLGFSPDGRSLLVLCEGFTPEGARIPRRHFLCDAEGRRSPVLVERPFAAPGQVDWERVVAGTSRMNG